MGEVCEDGGGCGEVREERLSTASGVYGNACLSCIPVHAWPQHMAVASFPGHRPAFRSRVGEPGNEAKVAALFQFSSVIPLRI